MQTKKVSNIEEMQGTDGKPRWAISFEGVKPAAIEWQKPTYAIGAELNVELVKPEKGNWYYKIVKGTPSPADSQKEKPQYGRSKDEQESIKRQSARRDAVEIYRHCVEVGLPFNRLLFEEYLGIMLICGDPVVAEAVKLGGKIEK